MFILSRRNLVLLWAAPILLLAACQTTATASSQREAPVVETHPHILFPTPISSSERQELEKAALSGSVEAAKRLATNCGFFNDFDGLYYWYTIGAENGDSDAMVGMVTFERNFVGMKKMSRERGIFWLKRAASLGNDRAVRELKQLEETTP